MDLRQALVDSRLVLLTFLTLIAMTQMTQALQASTDYELRIASLLLSQGFLFQG
jgi:hypothetical protein